MFVLALNNVENIPLSEDIAIAIGYASFTCVPLTSIQRYRQLADRGWPLDS